MMREKCSYSFLRSLVKGQDRSFFKDLTGVFCTIGGTLVRKKMDTFIPSSSMQCSCIEMQFSKINYVKQHVQVKLKMTFG
jgi:hypothetical protein